MMEHEKMQATPHAPLWTEQQAADYLQVSTRSLNTWRRSGALRYIRLGRVIRYQLADLESFIAARRQGGAR